MSGITIGGLKFFEHFVAFESEHITLTDPNLSQDEMIPFLKMFEKGNFFKVFELKLSGIGIGVRGAKLIGNGLKINSSLRILDLSNNCIGDEGADMIGEGLQINSSLKLLTLSGNGIGDRGAELIGEWLKINTSLRGLKLDNNCIGDEGAELIGEALQTNSSLQPLMLSLKEQSTGPFGFVASSSLMRSYRNLIDLSFDCVDLGGCVASESWEGLPVPSPELIQLGTRHIFGCVKAAQQGLIFVKYGKYFATDCELIDLKGFKLSQDELKSFIKKFTEGIFPKLHELNLSGNEIGDVGAELIGEGLKFNSSLYRLHLNDNGIGDIGAELIGEGLKVNSSLEELHLSWNHVACKGACGLAMGLSVNCGLRVLLLNGNIIRDDGGAGFGKGLKLNSSLLHLDLDRNMISNVGACTIGEGLKSNLSLQTLSLSGNKIGDRGAELIGEGLKFNSSLKALNLNDNSIQDKGAEMIGKGLQTNNSLQQLSLNDQSTGAFGCTASSSLMRGCKYLNELSFVCRKWRDCVSVDLKSLKLFEDELIPFLQVFKEGKFVNLQELNLSGNRIGDRGAELIGEGLKLNSSLKALNLDNNEIGDCGARMLAEGLSVNSHLLIISLIKNDIGDKGAEMIGEALQTNSSLQQLSLYNQSTGAFDFAASSSLMRGCRNLVSLSFKCCHWEACVASDSWKGLPVPPVDAIGRETRGVFDIVKAVLQGELFVFRRKVLKTDCERIDLNGLKLSEKRLIPFLQVFKEGKFVNLQELNLSGNGIRDRGAEMIGEGLKLNSSLHTLNLSSNSVGDTGPCLLAQGLKINSSLRILNLQGNLVGAVGARHLADWLNSTSSLKKLQLSKQQTGPFDARASSSLMRCCQRLDVLNYDCYDWKKCIEDDSWISPPALPVPPPEVIQRGTRSVFEFVKAWMQGGSFISRICRVMVVGPQMVGKTSLINALKDGRSAAIDLNSRTVSVEVSRQLMDGVDMHVWDFAGQEVYYLSHSVHFTQRCLYVLTWTPPQPASDSGVLSPPLTLEQLNVDMRLWLQMLAQHVPNAKVLLVGTRDDGSDEYQRVRAQVETAIDAEIQQLNDRVGPEFVEVQRMEKESQNGVTAAKKRWTASVDSQQFEGGGGDAMDEYEQEMHWWWLQSCDSGLEDWQKMIAREVGNGMMRVQMLRERIQLMNDGKARLERVASFTLDCLSGKGVPELQKQLSGLCSKHVQGMGEELPGWWLHALNALQIGDVSGPMSKLDAIERVRRYVPVISLQQEHSTSTGTGLWTSLRFWADSGRIFVYDDFVLPDPLRLVGLIKPLLHHDPPFLLDEACSKDDKELMLPSCRELSLRPMCLGFLRMLKAQAVLDRGLLLQLRAWVQMSSFHPTMLKFLADCHLICLTGSASDASAEILVTARSRELPALHSPYPTAAAGMNADDQEEFKELHKRHELVRSRFNGVLESPDSCRVLFLVSRYHIGIISRLQAFVHRARPREVSVAFNAAKDSLFMCRVTPHVEPSAQSCCAVRVLPFCDNEEARSVLSAFRKVGGPLSKESERRSRCGIVIAANDPALLAFMVRRVEKTLKRWSVCAECQCYVEGPPEICPFIRFDSPSSSDACALPLSAVLLGNLWEKVVPGVQMRDIFPRQRRCAMFLSYASDVRENTGTRYACETIRNGFQKAAMCSVWMDSDDTSDSRPWKPLMRQGLQTANVYIVCLTPLYLTQPKCLTELNDILTLVEASSHRKRLYILPLHPAVTARGRRHILEKSHFVLLPDFQAPILSHSKLRKHFLSDISMALLRKLTEHDVSDADPVPIQCLNTEPWLSAYFDRKPNMKWNGVRVTFDMCRAIVAKEGQSLGSLLVCSDERPGQAFISIDESNSASKPPSLEALDPTVWSVVDSVVGFEPPMLHLFRKEHALHLAECGVSSDELCTLIQNSSTALQSLPLYLQHLLKDVDFTHAKNSFGGSEDLANFLDWTATPPDVKDTLKVVFRVEGHDDKLLMNAILRLKFPMLQRPAVHFWSDFSYNSSSSSLKIRDRKVITDKIDDVGIVSIVRALQATARLKSFALRFLDLDDQDLKAFETRPKQEHEKESSLLLVTWRWGRAIENYLLPVTAPAALYLRGDGAASKLTAEVFVTIARHFFPVMKSNESDSKKGKLCGHSNLKFNDLIGAGWKAWSDVLKSPDVKVHKDTDAQAAAETLKSFSITLLGVAKLLVERHSSLYGSSGSRADDWLLHLANIRWEVRKGKYDILSTNGRVEKIDWKRACVAALDLPAERSSTPLNRGEADEAALWFNLPAVCSFLANLCNCNWLGGVVDDPADAVRVKHAAASALYLVQHALCVLLLGCDPSSPAPQVTLFSSDGCCCFLPLVGETVVTRCFTCDHEEHKLRERDSLGADDSNYLVELCRVGSVGWDSHAFMKAVYGRTHLGVEFNEQHINDSHLLYEQHLRPLLFGGTVESDRCREFTVSNLPEITVYSINGGNVKNGKLEPLVERRRAEFDCLCHQISILIGDSSYSASSGSSSPSVSSGKPGRAAAAGGGGASTPSPKASGVHVASPATKSSLPPAQSAVSASSASPSAEAVQGKEKKSKVKIQEDTSDCKANDQSYVSISLPSPSAFASSDPIVPALTSSPVTVPVSSSSAFTLASSPGSNPSRAQDDVSSSFALVSPHSPSVAPVSFIDLQASAAVLSPEEAFAHAELVGVLRSAGVVPTKDYEDLAHKLVSECIANEGDLQLALCDDPALLGSIGMKPGQQSCLTRYLNRPPAVAGETVSPPADPEAAALDSLKRFFEAAGVFPPSTYHTIALKLIEQGVADDISLRASLACSPPAFDLKSVVVRPVQATKIALHLGIPQ